MGEESKNIKKGYIPFNEGARKIQPPKYIQRPKPARQSEEKKGK